jgi:hypothetical protein
MVPGSVNLGGWRVLASVAVNWLGGALSSLLVAESLVVDLMRHYFDDPRKQGFRGRSD